MAKADIEIDGAAANEFDATIDTLVQLSNNDDGDETTYLWEIVDQPFGTADILSSTTIENPTFTPKKEGTYLLQLTIDLSLITEQTDRKVLVVRELKSDQRIPAAQEDTEAGPRGWGSGDTATLGMENMLKFLMDSAADPSVIVGVAGGALAVDEIVQVSGVSTIKTGLPGEEDLPTITLAPATTAINLEGLIGIVVGQVAGGGAVAVGETAFIRIAGLVQNTFTGAPTVGDPVFVDDSALVSLTPGTLTRKIGKVIEESGGLFKIFFDGSLVSDASATGTDANLWAKPVAPDARDDEFESTVLDAAWTVTPAESVSAIDPYAVFAAGGPRVELHTDRRRSWVMMQPDSDCQIHKPITIGANLFVWSRMSFNIPNGVPINNEGMVAIALTATSLGLPDLDNSVRIYVNESDVGTVQAQFLVREAAADILVVNTTDVDDQGQAIAYGAIQKIGTTYHGWAGTENGSWIHLGSIAMVTPLDRALIRSFTAAGGPPGNMIMGVDFIRFVDSATFLP
jgi:hypothetical protein